MYTLIQLTASSIRKKNIKQKFVKNYISDFVHATGQRLPKLL